MTPEARAARERKQKIFIAVGGVFVLAMLAIQLPKILGGGSAPETSAGTDTTVTQPPAAAPSGTPAAAPGGDVALPAVEGTKLRDFSLFAGKDPFVQQVKTSTTAASTTEGSSGTEASAKKAAEKAPSQGFSVGEKAAASITVISVNGTREALEAGATFPSTDPVFVLIAEQPKQKTVTVGIAGGAYENGSRKVKLKVGKPVVLENTATGAKYRLVLVSVGSGSSAPSAPAPGTSTTPGSPPPTP
jgi:hypothetical protein